jgi:hypothetical protein
VIGASPAHCEKVGELRRASLLGLPGEQDGYRCALVWRAVEADTPGGLMTGAREDSADTTEVSEDRQ